VTLATVGNLTLDVVGGRPPRPGGTAWYAVEAYRALGKAAVVVTRSASEEQWIAEELRRGGTVEVAWSPASTTAAFAFSYDEDGHREMTVSAVGDPWTVGDVEGWARDALGEIRWVQVGALLRTDFSAVTLQALAEDRHLLVDAQGLARAAELGPLRRDANVDPACFASVSMLKLNEDEARILARGESADAIRAIGVDEVVVTLGEGGARVVTPGHDERVEPGEIAETSDPTGAGDLFGAAYLAARAEDAEPVEAARAAVGLVSRALADR